MDLSKVDDPNFTNLFEKTIFFIYSTGSPFRFSLRFRGGYDLAAINLAENKLVINRHQSIISFLASPLYAELFVRLSQLKATQTLDVYTPGYYAGEGWIDQTLMGTLSDLVERIQLINVEALTCDAFEDEPFHQEFLFNTILDIPDITFYHATRGSALPLIREHGLLPALQARHLVIDSQGYLAGDPPLASISYGDWTIGWTELNLHLQDANYLTASLDYAHNIAVTLLGREWSNGYEDSTFILQIPGSILNPRLIGLDEDVMRDDMGHIINNCDSNFPQYISSLTDPNLVGITYHDKLPGNLEIVEELKAEDYFDEDE